MEAVRTPPVEAGLPIRSPVTPARGAGADVDVPRRHRATHEESGRAVSPADALLFQQVVLPHLDAAYNLARWLTRDPDDARDAVQEAALRAFRFFRTFRGGDARPWFLTIVRNTVSSRRERERQAEVVPFGALDREGGEPFVEALASPVEDPEALLRRLEDKAVIDGLLERLPPEFREVLVLRELEGLSYKEIAEVARIPIGTVMSRLARARQLLLARGRELAPEECDHGARGCSAAAAPAPGITRVPRR